eukprot:s321_g34.t1
MRTPRPERFIEKVSTVALARLICFDSCSCQMLRVSIRLLKPSQRSNQPSTDLSIARGLDTSGRSCSSMARKARVLLLLASLVALQITFCGWTRQRPDRFTTKPLGVPFTHHKARRSSVAAKPEIAVFDKIFEESEPHDVYNTRPGRQDYLQRLEASNLAIIDRVNDTMTHEVIDFDVKHWSDLILDLSAQKPSSKKSFLATVRGSGGGKTRALEELRWELLGEGVLPLAFTYNSAMELDFDEFRWSNSVKLNYGMAVVARLATVFYGVRLPKILSLLDQDADLASMLKMEQDADFPIQLIRGFLSHAVKKLRCRRDIHTVVVLADEVARAEEAFVQAFDLRKGADVTSILRKAVLDQEILPDLQATLVISSLTLGPLGASPSGRFPWVLQLSQNLNATKVAASWWQRADDNVATFVAAALSELPRFVEFAAEFFKDNQTSTKRLNQTEVKGVFSHVRKRLQERYGRHLPKADALYPAIFGEQTERNNKVMSLITRSIFVNSLTDMEQSDGSDGLMIKPVPSLFMLSAAAANSELRGDRFAQLVATFPGDIELTNEGRPLEWCLRWWLQMRLATAAGKQNFPLAKLLGVDRVTFADDSDLTMLNKLNQVVFTVPPNANNVRTTFRNGNLVSSHKDKGQFLEQIGLLGSDMNATWLLDAPRGEAWDAMLAVFDTEASHWFLVFLELKAQENQLRDRNQAEYVQTLVEEAKQKESSPGLVEALREGRYCFLYITTAQGQSEAGSLAIVLKEEDTAQFFGPLAAVHLAIRQAFP